MLRIHDAFLNGVCFCLLVAGIAAYDTTMRSHIVNVVAGDSMKELSIIAAPANRVARVAFETLNNYRTDHEAMFAFAVVAIILFIFLFRS